MKDDKGRTVYIYASKQFVAHNTGELFLFANDAVFALPRFWLGADRMSEWWSWFSDNNKGPAQVFIRVAAPPAAPPPPGR